MSIGEIVDQLESYSRVKERELKQRIQLDRIMAERISERVSLIMNGGDPATLLNDWDYFPSLFDEEKKLYQIQNKERSLRLYSAKFREFAQQHNERRGGG